MKSSHYREQGRRVSYAEASRYVALMAHSEEHSFLSEVSAVALQQAVRMQEKAFSAFFKKRSNYPRFKTHSSRRSARFSKSGFTIRGGHLRPAKFTAPLRYVWTWPNLDIVDLNPSSITISEDSAGRWFVSFSVEMDDPAPRSATNQSVGIDLGLTDLVTLSTGEKIAHPRHMDKRERRLKHYQRMMARRRPKPGQAGSTRYRKAKLLVAKRHAKVADARRDHLHKLSTRLVRENDVIAIEDLAVSNMVKNRSLAKHISRSGWYELRRQLEYKANRYGRQLVVVDRFFPSSKTCSSCGHLLNELSLSTRHWTCPTCGTRHDRDVNAAQNIINVAVGLIDTENARGATVRAAEATPGQVAVKREPLWSG